jgi:hypothetical protein
MIIARRVIAVSSARKWLVGFLVVLASLSIALIALYLGAGRNPNRHAGSTRHLAPGQQPDVVFAEGVTSGREDVDEFIHHFTTLCKQGDYEEYRLCWTAYAMPVSRERFNKLYGFAKRITITDIVPAPKSDAKDKPAYLIRARAELDPKAAVPHKDVDLLVQWEENRWAVAPAPSRGTDTAPASRPTATQKN